MTSLEPSHRSGMDAAAEVGRETHNQHSNIALDLTLAIAAQRVLRPRCLLRTSAAQRSVQHISMGRQ
jgi:hypothetical protein